MPGRALVAGGAGFIGGHLCKRLLELGCEVICVDNLVTGSRRTVEDLRAARTFSFLEADVSLPIELEGPLDYVLHYASPASPDDFSRIPLEILRAGTRATDLLAALALQRGARFLLASTSEVYGDPAVHPQPESYWGNVNPIGPRGVYDEAKRAAEAFTMAYHRLHGLDTRIVRIFNTYGPGMRPEDGRALPNFITQALRGEPITVYGDGGQTRSLCFVADHVEGALSLLASTETRPVNIGTEEEVTMIQLAEAVKVAAGSPSRLVFRALPEDDPRQRRPDISRAREVLGWSPGVPLEQGLPSTIEWFRGLTG